jgi:glucose/arabinose dehydrogenase
VPDVVAGFSMLPLSSIGADALAAGMAFGPGGPDLYVAASTTNHVVRIPLTWTPLGVPVAGVPTDYAGGFSQPLGVVFRGDAMYVTDSHVGADTTRTVGRLTRVDPDGSQHVVLDGLPNGRHNTNHPRFGPDGRLYIPNGNPNDNGIDGGAPDVFPYSGAILSVDLAQLDASPATLHYQDEQGQTLPPDQIAGAPINADFASKVRVLAHGFRNIYGVAFDAGGHVLTAMNGPDSPSGQDLFYTVQAGADYGFPFCYNVGPVYGVGAAVHVQANPKFPDHDCAAVPPAGALLGWHVCATGLDVPPARGPWAFPPQFGGAYVGECGPFFPEQNVLEGNAYPNTGHKVVRVALDADGRATEVSEFLTGLALPTDAVFGPDGALYVADAAMVDRVAPLVPSLG